MTNIKLNEQITFLRKQNNMTQEDLAKALGVSNQAVSKWESAPAETSFHNAFRLAILLHEAAVTRGYKDYCPWNTDLNHGL